MSLHTDILFSFAPLLIFLGLMIFVYLRGSKTNTNLIINLEEIIFRELKPYTKEIKKVKIRPDEYEYRCTANNRHMRILTVHLKLVARSFIIQWFVNLLSKEKEKLFLGAKITDGSGSDEEPVYKFEMVPYRKKMFIRQRFEKFIEMDDIRTVEKEVDKNFMVKSESQAYVSHLVDNEELMGITKTLEPYLEHISIGKSKEDTDPHISVTFHFNGTNDDVPIESMIKFFFLTTEAHIEHHAAVKRIIAKGTKGKSMTRRRGSAKRGAGRKKKATSKVSRTSKRRKN